MTNTLAIVTGLVLLALIAADLLLNGAGALLFLGKKFLDLLAYVAFWR